MTPIQARAIAYIVVFAAIFGFGYWVASQHYGKRIVSLQLEIAQAQRDSTAAAREAERQHADAIEKLRTEYNEKVKAHQENNDRLTADVIALRKRLLVKASPSVPNTDAAGQPVDGATCELTAEARQDYFDLRKSIGEERLKTEYLQGFILEALKLCGEKK